MSARPYLIGLAVLACTALVGACTVEEGADNGNLGGGAPAVTTTGGYGGTYYGGAAACDPTYYDCSAGGYGGSYYGGYGGTGTCDPTYYDCGTGGNGGAGGTTAVTGTAYIRFAHLAQVTDPIDICIRSSSATDDWSAYTPIIGDATSGFGAPGTFIFPTVTTVVQTDPGSLSVRVVTGNAPNCGDSYLIYANEADQLVQLADATSYTVAVLGTSAEGIVTVKAYADPPASSTASTIQTLNALTQTDGTIDFGIATGATYDYSALTANNVAFAPQAVTFTPPTLPSHIVAVPTGSPQTLAEYPFDPGTFAAASEFTIGGRRNVYLVGTSAADTNVGLQPFLIVCDVPADPSTDVNGVAGDGTSSYGILTPLCQYAQNPQQLSKRQC